MKMTIYFKILTFIFSLLLLFTLSNNVHAQHKTTPTPIPSNNPATTSAEATKSGVLNEASPSSIVKRVVEKQPDITEAKPEVKGKLERFLEDNRVGELTPFNSLSHAIRYAVSQGVPANTIVLILLFPLVATVVVIARHIIGLKSFGIFTPALLSVAFLATGLLIGISLFILILLVATLVRMLLRQVKIQYLPRMALFIWFVSMAILGVLIVSPALNREELITIGIFPILILILLTEDFLDIQITRSFSQSLLITFETLLLAVTCFYLMNLEALQKFALVNPELFSLALLLIIGLVEQYSGLRLLEIWRFRKLLSK